MFPSMTPATWLALVGTPVLVALGQVLFKMTSASTAEFNLRSILNLALNPSFIAALALYGLGTLIWVHVLKVVPLTIAYSFMGLTFALVPLLAHYFFGEALTFRYSFGALLIFAGLLVINA